MSRLIFDPVEYNWAGARQNDTLNNNDDNSNKLFCYYFPFFSTTDLSPLTFEESVYYHAWFQQMSLKCIQYNGSQSRRTNHVQLDFGSFIRKKKIKYEK